jgi:nucleotide-binding universal stress UspA family protein
MKKKRCIVVGTDFSEGALGALKSAVDLAMNEGAEVVLVNVRDPHATPDATPTSPRVEEELDVATCCELRRLVRELGAEGVTFTPVTRSGAPWEKLENVAADFGADLIVVGASGSRRVSSSLLGSVAERVVRTANRTVLVVRPPNLPKT